MHKCAVCGIALSSEDQYAEHVKGKRHKRQVEIFQHREEEARRSLFVPLNAKTGNDKTVIRSAFEQHGPISRVIVDPNKGAFAIIEFASADPVTKLLSEGQHIVHDGVKFKYLPRKVQLKPVAGAKGNGDDKRRARAKPATAASSSAAHARPAKITPTKPDPIEKQTVRGTLLAVPYDFPPIAYVPPDTATPRSQEHLRKFGQQVQMVVGHLKQKPSVQATHERVLKELDTVVRACAPDGVPSVDRERPFVVAVGSLVTGLAREGSDVDVSVSAPWLTGRDGLHTLAQALRSAQHFGQVLCLPEARCPIIKAVHLTTSTPIEVSLHNRLAERNTQLVDHYMRLWPGFRTLVRAACIWFKALAVPWSSYFVTLLAIRYMQMKHEVPSLQQIAADSINVQEGCAPACEQCALEWSLRMGDDDGSQSHKRTKAQLGDSEAFVTIHEHDCMFCPHQQPSHYGLDIAADLALLGHVFLDFFDFVAAWMAVHPDIVMDIRPPGAVQSSVSREAFLQHDSAIGGAAGLVFVDPFDRTHNVARNVTARHSRVAVAGVCWLFDEWLRKSGKRFSFHTHCMYMDKIMAGVQQFCEELSFTVRDPADGEGVDSGVRGAFDAIPDMAGTSVILEAAEVTWVNRRRRRRQQQLQQQQSEAATGDGNISNTGSATMPMEHDASSPVLQVVVRVQPPYLAADCMHASEHLPTGFETWAALFKKQLLGTLKHQPVTSGSGDCEGGDKAPTPTSSTPAA
ncbi:hypothetical protein PTSG_01341 [Salpingoeca rosetta]|uniref:C2H2-type domain-containing protein n=1 Tax=Salpingoeca rosetta (strain ATCC 50818 / BSB-021) TaxID=946362 RepID=F2U025_SALR5|nr:uncharacterized protein PTSG_01341 [Salpingoeca rosetta]EGD80753.1 hypothetical protein PTSG_01341 [Salpingoeca rosetta]|eukprot:XP_004997314.1 hypothetical protein PTSG_01341 [Salpingoeca rosetta]